MKSIPICLTLFALLYSVPVSAQWVQANGPYGGQILSICPKGSTIFTGTYDGVFFSTNNGTNWARGNGSYCAVHSIVYSGSVVFAATDCGVYSSQDNGMTWNPASALQGKTVNALGVNGVTLFAGAYGDGIYVSTDNGVTWALSSTGLPQSPWVVAFAMIGSNVFAGLYGGGVFLSTDNGASWTGVNNGLTYTAVYALATSGGNLLSATVDGVYRSTDNGAHWAKSSNAMTYGDVRALAANGTTVYAGTAGGGIFSSTDGGINWSPLSPGPSDPWIASFAIAGNYLFAGTFGGGLFRSGDGGASWVAANTGLIVQRIWALANSTSGLFAGSDGSGVFRSTDNGGSWTRVSSGLDPYGIFTLTLCFDGANLYAGGEGGIFLSTNNGATWNPVNAGLTNTIVQAIIAYGGKIYAGTYGGVFVSTNGGALWTEANAGLTNPTVWSFAASGTNLVAGTSDGVFLSTNGGGSWAAANAGITNTTAYAVGFAGSTLFTGTNLGVFLSHDIGKTWSITALVGGDETLAPYGTDVFAGNVLLSADGTQWTNPPPDVGLGTTLSIALNNTYVFVGTYENGIWRRAISDFLPSGAITGSVLAGGAGLAGVTVELLGTDGTPIPNVQPLTTDSQGKFTFAQVPAPGNYEVMIVEPLGYSPDANPKSLSLTGGGTSSVNFTLTKNVLCDKARSSAYWKYQFDAYVCKRGKAEETQQQLTKDIAEVQQHYTPHFPVFAGKTSFSDWQAILGPKFNAGMADQAKAELAGLVLNVASLKIGQYTTVTRDKRTAGDVLTYVSKLITKGNAGEQDYLSAFLLALMVNNQVTILSGIVPKGNTLYKSDDQQAIDWGFETPSQYELAQNYPNPFNPATTIRYAVPVDEDVSLVVFDVQGQKVADLVSGRVNAGYYEVTFDGTGLASGVYFYRLKAGSYLETKKLLLLR